MDALIDIILAYAGPIGVALCLLAVWLWHRFVEPITFPWRIRLEWADVDAEREREHARRAQELKQAAQWADAREARERQLFTVIKGRRSL